MHIDQMDTISGEMVVREQSEQHDTRIQNLIRTFEKKRIECMQSAENSNRFYEAMVKDIQAKKDKNAQIHANIIRDLLKYQKIQQKEHVRQMRELIEYQKKRQKAHEMQMKDQAQHMMQILEQQKLRFDAHLKNKRTN